MDNVVAKIGATEDEIKDVIEEAYMDDDHNMDIVNNSYDIKIRKL